MIRTRTNVLGTTTRPIIIVIIMKKPRQNSTNNIEFLTKRIDTETTESIYNSDSIYNQMY